MTQLSKFPLKQKVRDEIINSLWWLIVHLSTENEVISFFNEFFTKTEKIMLAKRLAIAFMLEKGYSYYQIRDTLKVSTSTIVFISNWLDKGGVGYRLAIKKLSKKEKLDAFWSEISSLMKEIGKDIAKGRRVLPRRY